MEATDISALPKAECGLFLWTTDHLLSWSLRLTHWSRTMLRYGVSAAVKILSQFHVQCCSSQSTYTLSPPRSHAAATITCSN